MTTAWIEELKLPKRDEQLMAHIRVPPIAVENLDELPVDTAVKMIDAALSEFYRPTPQDVQAIRRIVGLALAHALTHYASEDQFLRGAKCREPLPLESTLVMLTGLAGVGKSKILSALARLLLRGHKVRVSKDLPEFPITPVVTAFVGPNIRHVDVMNEIADCLGLGAVGSDDSADDRERSKSTYAKADRDSIRHAKLRLYQQGVCSFLGDELQFLTRSREANALLTKLLAFFAVFGIPVVYACNYSAGHRLKMRPQEDRTRLLYDPIILLPDPPDEPSYLGLLKDYKVVFNGVLDIEPARDALEFHAMTFGLKRSGKRLLVIGYRIARIRAKKQGTKVSVNMADLREAYRSVSYEDDRKTVEECQAILAGIDSTREDLVCPFDLPTSLVAAQKRLCEVEHQRRHGDAMLHASMTSAERSAAKKEEKVRDSSKAQLTRPTKAKQKKRASVTAEALLKSVLF